MSLSKQLAIGSAAMQAFSVGAIALGFAVGGVLCGENAAVGWAALLVPNAVMQGFAIVLYRLRAASEHGANNQRRWAT